MTDSELVELAIWKAAECATGSKAVLLREIAKELSFLNEYRHGYNRQDLLEAREAGHGA